MRKEFRRLFYPHSSNNYKAGILQPSGLCVLIALFLLSQSLLNFSSNLIPGVLGFASNITPEEIVESTNKKRLERGIASLKINGQLNEAARQKAADMFALNYWSHVSPRGVDPWSFIVNAGYVYLYAGENLARDFSGNSAVVEAWMNSPTHRDNLLNNKYEEIGVAVVDGVLQGQETTLVVQMFASPKKVAASIPKEAVVMGTAPSVVLSESEGEERKIPLLSSFDLTKTLSLVFAGLLFAVLAFDGFVTRRKKTTRISGHNFTHGTFIIILIVLILISQQGIIL